MKFQHPTFNLFSATVGFNLRVIEAGEYTLSFDFFIDGVTNRDVSGYTETVAGLTNFKNYSNYTRGLCRNISS